MGVVIEGAKSFTVSGPSWRSAARSLARPALARLLFPMSMPWVDASPILADGHLTCPVTSLDNLHASCFRSQPTTTTTKVKPSHRSGPKCATTRAKVFFFFWPIFLPFGRASLQQHSLLPTLVFPFPSLDSSLSVQHHHHRICFSPLLNIPL